MLENGNEEVIEIDLMEVLMLFAKKWWLIALGAVLLGAAGFFWSSLGLPPQYESTTEIYILNTANQDSITYTDLQMGSQLTKDYAHLITTRDVLEPVIETLGLDDDYDGLVERIDVETPSDTRIVAITVTDQDPSAAQAIANEVREVASAHITNVMAIDAVNVASMANYPLEPSGPNILLWTLLGGVIGACLPIGVLLIKYLLDDSIKTSEDVEKYLQLSTLGMIPLNAERRDRRERTGSHESGRRAGPMPGGGKTLEEIDLEAGETGQKGESR